MNRAHFRRSAALAAGAMLLLSGCPSPTATDLQGSRHDPSSPQNDYLFDLSKLPELTLTLSVSEWNTFLSDYDQNNNNEEIVEASLAVTRDGSTTTFPRVGFGLRGNLSRKRAEAEDPASTHNPANPIWQHAHFKIDFNAYDPQASYRGVTKLNLKWFKDDPTRTKEVYCYDLFRRFGATQAPRASYAQLTLRIVEADGSVTEAPFGAYVLLEGADENYVKARYEEGTFSSKDGFLFKCLWTGPGPATLTEASGLDAMIGEEEVNLNESLSKRYTYDLKTKKDELPAATAALKDFIHKLNTLSDDDFAAWLPTVMDVDLFLKTLAVNVTVGMWDDYWYNSNNYYLYLERSGRVTYIPYDYDNTLGTGIESFDPGTQDPLAWGSSTDRPLATRILAIPAYLQKYKDYLGQLIDPAKGLFDSASSIPRLQAWRSLIRTAALSDATSGYDTAATWNTDAPASWGAVRPYKILSGDDNESGSAPNYFLVREKYTAAQIGQAPLPSPSPTPTPSVTTPPTISDMTWYPPTGSKMLFQATLSGSGDMAAVAVPHGENAPSAAQIVAGKKADGSPAPGAQKGAQVRSGNYANLWVTGLTPGSAYDCYAVALAPDGSSPGSDIRTRSYTMAPTDFSSPALSGSDGSDYVFSFSYYGDSSWQVYLNGDINNWGFSGGSYVWSDSYKLAYNSEKGLYQLTLPKSSFSSGQQYKFTIRNPVGGGDQTAWWFCDSANMNTQATKDMNSVLP